MRRPQWWLAVLILSLTSTVVRAQDPTEEPSAPADEAAAEESEESVHLTLDQPERGVIRWDQQAWQTFTVEVPDDAMVLTLEITGAPADLDLFARRGAPMASYNEDAEHSSQSRLFNDTLRITRASEPSLTPGLYYVDVAYTVSAEPRVGKHRVAEIPFQLTASVIRARIDGKLTPSESLESATGDDTGWFRTFVVDVPRSAKAMRIDLTDVSADLDILARPGLPILTPDEADHRADSVLSRETLVIERDSDPPLSDGTWYIQVIDPYELEHVAFTANLNFDEAPAASLLAIPSPRTPSDALERALFATVEILNQTNSGSGTLISPDGWVLTAAHVVEAEGGGTAAPGELVMSLCFDPKLPPVETFRGSVVAVDTRLDLALVKIETGLYGQPLPAGFRFPFVEMGDSDRLRIGDPLTLLGFPTVGGRGSRASVSLTRGVVSGFDTTPTGTLVKTDAEIGHGNSGGAAVDAAWRLVGVPTGTVEATEGYSQLGYILPLSRLPEEWKSKIKP